MKLRILLFAGMLLMGRWAVAELFWDENEAGAENADGYVTVSASTDLAALGIEGEGARPVVTAIRAALAGQPAGTKARVLLGKTTEGSSRWQFVYLRSLVLLDAEGRPDGVEKFAIQQGISGVESHRIIPWKHGVKDGVEQTFQASILREEVPWKNGKMEGARKSYFEGGKVEAETHYVGGVAHGPTRVYDAAGNLVREGVMKNGKRDGKMTEYWPGSRNLKRVAIYRDGNVAGPVREYYLSGKLKREVTVQDDAYHGEDREYNESGQVTTTRHWVDGTVVTKEVFDQQGK